MNSKVSFWAVLTALTAIMSVIATTPVHAVPVPSDEVGQRIARLRKAMMQQSVGQIVDEQNLDEGLTLISRSHSNLLACIWDNSVPWNNVWDNLGMPPWNNV